MNKTSGRGRRSGSPDTQEQIRQSARRRFLAEGYQGVTMRAIAADAGVDVALVSYYFGSKQGLFAATMALPVNPADVFALELAGDLDTLAERVLTTMLAVWDDPSTGTPLRTVAASAASDPDLGRLVREAVGREINQRLADRLGEPRGAQRAAAFTTQMAGVIFARYVLRIEPIATMSIADVVRSLGPSLQLALQPAG
jgi:AcrR family transcriptional regulator